MPKIRVLLADDQDIIRTGLTIILNHQPDLEVVGQAADGPQAVELARQLQPDVILMDIKMPQLNGIQATRRIVAAQPRTQIIMLTTYDNDDWVFDAIRAGAIGYLLKDAAGDAAPYGANRRSIRPWRARCCASFSTSTRIDPLRRNSPRKRKCRSNA